MIPLEEETVFKFKEHTLGKEIDLKSNFPKPAVNYARTREAKDLEEKSLTLNESIDVDAQPDPPAQEAR